MIKYIRFIVVLCFGSFYSANAQTSSGQFVKIETSMGTMVFRLFAETPKHNASFIKLVKEGYFDRYDFNRVLKGFVAQGGETDSAYVAMEKNGLQPERIMPEFNAGLFHKKGVLAAGRDENKAKSSFTGQFYIVDGKKYTDSILNVMEKRIGVNYHFPEAARKIYKEVGGVPHLDQNYTVFGEIVKGMDVFDKLMAQKTNKAGLPETRIWMKLTVVTGY